MITGQESLNTALLIQKCGTSLDMHRRKQWNVERQCRAEVCGEGRISSAGSAGKPSLPTAAGAGPGGQRAQGRSQPGLSPERPQSRGGDVGPPCGAVGLKCWFPFPAALDGAEL